MRRVRQRKEGFLQRPQLIWFDMSLNMLIWNAWGVANVNTQNDIKRLIMEHKISVLAVIEPLTKPRPDFFSRKFGLQFRGFNCNGQIWLFAEEGFEVDGWDDSEQILHARLVTPALPAPFFISVAYGECTREGRSGMWNKLWTLATKWMAFLGLWEATSISLYLRMRGKEELGREPGRWWILRKLSVIASFWMSGWMGRNSLGQEGRLLRDLIEFFLVKVGRAFLKLPE